VWQGKAAWCPAAAVFMFTTSKPACIAVRIARNEVQPPLHVGGVRLTPSYRRPGRLPPHHPLTRHWLSCQTGGLTASTARHLH
jgi:hypothetical protein